LKTKGIYFLYRSLQAFGLPLVALYFFWRGLRDRAYWPSLAERLGFLPRSFKQTGPGAIWLHAVSVGELLASIEFLKRLRREFPRTRLFVSTTTLAGRALASQRLGSLADGCFYAPLDTVWAVRRVLRTLRPSLLLVSETEIWPNLFRETKRTGAALAVVNGRLSDRAYPRYLRFARLFRHVLPQADSILTQTATMRDRFVLLGAPQDRVSIAGNFKYDLEAHPAAADSPVMRFLGRLRPAAVWIAASTMPPASTGDIDEDTAVLAAFHELASTYPNLLLILVPRKPEQFDIAARKLETAGIRYLRRSLLGETSTLRLPGVLLLDSIGELGGLFCTANVVFMGGTLANRGGHNILEPAFFSKPIISGPHLENFQSIADEFIRVQALVSVRDARELAEAVGRLLADPALASDLGERARECATSQRGATARSVAEARALYDRHLARYWPAQPWRCLYSLLAKAWTWGACRDRARALAHRRRLPVPVISVGNITMGGTGKTPCVLRLAADLRNSGAQPGILTRGYGRQSTEPQVILPPGAPAGVDRTGDEPQLFLRSVVGPVGIGADRYQTGNAVVRQFGVDVLLLDDAFQHHRLDRTIDLVLLDGLNPFGGGSVFPLGRLREPLAALARADLFLLTRSDLTDLGPAIEHQVRLWNPRAPIFRTRLLPTAWIEHATGARHGLAHPPFDAVLAFCGLGNPAGFRRTLETMGVRLAEWIEFEDHHRYSAAELQQLRALALAKNATALVTTAKDAVNLCDRYDALLAPLRLFRLEVELSVEQHSEFLAEIRRLMKAAQAPQDRTSK
jgi:tetraacyldisaccharide 4'-kinase